MPSHLKSPGLFGTGGWILSSGAIVSITAAAGAQTTGGPGTATLTLNKTTLLPNTAGQTLDLEIQSTGGNNQIEGADVFAQINNGSTSGTMPVITGVNLTAAGEIFAGDTAEPTETDHDWIAANLASSSAPLTDTGELAILTINTTGLSSGSTFTLQFDTNDGNTDLTDSTGSNTNIVLSGGGNLPGAGIMGTITLAVPEPAAGVISCSSAAGLLMRRRRRA
jgi:hypothetical protein